MMRRIPSLVAMKKGVRYHTIWNWTSGIEVRGRENGLGLEAKRKIRGVSPAEVFGASTATGDAGHFLAARAGALQVRIIGRRYMAAADAHELRLPESGKHRAEFAAHHAVRATYDLF